MEFEYGESVGAQAEDTVYEAAEAPVAAESVKTLSHSYRIGERDWELRYTLKRIDLIEDKIGSSVLSMFLGQGGFAMPRLAHIKLAFAYGLKAADGGFTSPEHGMKMADQFIEDENGYTIMVNDVLLALKRDCPFFFPAD